MKTINLVVGLLFFTNMLVNAQVTKVTTSTHHFDENTIVNDSAGNRLPFDVWHAKLISGNYSLKSNGNFSDTTVFHLHRMTKAEKDLNNSLLGRKAENQLSQFGQNAIPSQVNILQPPRPPESPSFKMGDKPTSFRANDINGNRIKLKELQGKIVVLNFWFIGCPPCRQEIPELNKIVEKYANNPNVVFVAIGLDDKYDIREFLKTKPYSFQIIADGRMYADLYHVSLYPTTVILDKEGKVCFDTVSFGPSSPYWITKTIDGLL